VLGPVVASLGELDDAAPADVGVPIGLRDFLPVPRDVVEHQPFAQRQIAERDLVGSQPPQDLVEENGARHGEVRAPRFETRHPQPFLEIERHQILANPPDVLR
jgi:hypothetical protein